MRAARHAPKVLHYKIAPVKHPQKYSVVHFDRLKLCPPTMCRTNPVTFSPVSEFVSPSCPGVGEGAELVDDCDVTDAQDSQTLDGQSRDQAGRPAHGIRHTCEDPQNVYYHLFLTEYGTYSSQKGAM